MKALDGIGAMAAAVESSRALKAVQNFVFMKHPQGTLAKRRNSAQNQGRTAGQIIPLARLTPGKESVLGKSLKRPPAWSTGATQHPDCTTSSTISHLSVPVPKNRVRDSIRQMKLRARDPMCFASENGWIAKRDLRSVACGRKLALHGPQRVRGGRCLGVLNFLRQPP